MLAKVEPEQLSREDWRTYKLLMSAIKKREEMRRMEEQLAQSIAEFGQRRGYLFGCYREHHMVSELRRRGFEI